MKKYFDDNCACKESQLFGEKSLLVNDNKETAETRKIVMDNPEKGKLHIKLGDALSYQLRYIEAIESYTRAVLYVPRLQKIP